MKCSRCGGTAVINMRQHRLRLCAGHFVEWFVSITQRTIEKYRMFDLTDRVLVAVSGGMGAIILSEATLSFLGIGLQPPNPSWGAMLYQYYGYWRTELWPLLFIPAAVLVAIVLAFSFLGDGLNEALNPQLD